VTGTSLLVQAIEEVWAAIRSHHPDVPEVIVTLAAGSTGARQRLTLGHFAADRWVRGSDQVHELFVGGEGLERGAKAVLGTLLHEAAHGVAQQRDIKDTSRQGRYHNKQYKSLAQELGLLVAHEHTFGWSTTMVPAETQTLYAAEIDRLAEAITAHRKAEADSRAGGGRTSNNNGSALVCECGRKIRASQTVIEAGPIICGLCETEFRGQGQFQGSRDRGPVGPRPE
jgi:hypothetical protein